MALASILLSWAMGWAVARTALGRERWRPAWMRWLLELSLGWTAGTAISSAVYFLSVWIGAPAFVAPLVELLALAGCVALWRRSPSPEPAGERAGAHWALRLTAAVTLALFLLSFAAMAKCQVDGAWDALFMWNVRAKFLASGDAGWRAAITDRVNGLNTPSGHADYPLLTSSFVGRAWRFGDPADPAVPIAAGLLYSLALVGLLGAALAWIGSETAGLVGMTVLLSCDLFVTWSAAQYADIPLALYALGSVALAAAARGRNWPPALLALAGFFAGAAAWTKNEGIPWMLAALAAGLLFGGVRALVPMAAGAAPVTGLAMAFKLFLAPASTTMLPGSFGEAVARLAEPGRWWLVAQSFAGNFLAASNWWAHPVLLLGAAAVALGFADAEERSRLWRLAVAPVGLLAADAGVLLITSADLAWNLGTASDRLLLQALPALIFVFAATLRAPQVAAPMPAASAPRKARKARRS